MIKGVVFSVSTDAPSVSFFRCLFAALPIVGARINVVATEIGCLMTMIDEVYIYLHDMNALNFEVG